MNNHYILLNKVNKGMFNYYIYSFTPNISGKSKYYYYMYIISTYYTSFA